MDRSTSPFWKPPNTGASFKMFYPSDFIPCQSIQPTLGLTAANMPKYTINFRCDICQHAEAYSQLQVWQLPTCQSIEPTSGLTATNMPKHTANFRFDSYQHAKVYSQLQVWQLPTCQSIVNFRCDICQHAKAYSQLQVWQPPSDHGLQFSSLRSNLYCHVI